MSQFNAVVIGSGIAGLAAAIRLAVAGYSVDVFEKNAVAGGKLGLLRADGFVFDTGPSLFTQPEQILELFEIANEPIQEYFQFEKLNIACRYFYENGKILNAFTDAQRFASEMEKILKEPADHAIQYLQQAAEHYQSLGAVFLNENLHTTKTWINTRVLKALRHTSPALLLRSLDHFNRNHFETREAVQLFNRFATYNGSNPFNAPAMLSIIPHLEHNEGIYYPQGGMISIVNALYDLAVRKGVRFHFNAVVDSIDHTNRKITGISSGGEFYPALVVLSNADVFFTYKRLLKDEIAAEKFAKQERSSSALVFYWGINKIIPELSLHNIFFTKNQKEEFKSLFDLEKIYHDPTVYINVTSVQEQSMAPEGMQNLFVMINAPAAIDINEEYILEIKKSVIWKLNRMLQVRMEDYIIYESVMSPKNIEANTYAWQGALYGTSSNNIFSAFRRHPNFSKKYTGLYFAGGTVHPGGGIPLCFRSAKIAVALAMK